MRIRSKRIGRPPTMLMIGQRVGKLTVVEQKGNTARGEWLWRCRCDCGAFVSRRAVHLTRQRRTDQYVSCGCVLPEMRRTLGASRIIHGHYSNAVAKSGGTPTYRSWQSMISRCHYAGHIAYEQYGGRAISVCREWRESFIVFLADMGERHEGMTLDRIDRRFGYFPLNCRWATDREQRDNKRGVEHRPAFMHPKLINESDPRVAAYRIWR